MQRRFHTAHQRRYGHMAQAEAVQIVNFSVTAVGLMPKPALKAFDAVSEPKSPTSFATRPAFCDASGATNVPIYRRDSLQPGMHIDGPAVIEEATSTTVIYPGQRAEVDCYLNIDVALASAY